MNGIINFTIKNIENNQFKIEKKLINWSSIIKNQNEFYKEIANIILNEQSLYYFISTNNDAAFLENELSDKQKKKLKIIIEQLIKNPEEFYHNYMKEQELISELDLIATYQDLEIFIVKYGIDYSIKGKNLKKDKAYLKNAINKEAVYGVFGEIMLYTVIEKLMNTRNIVISKLSFITAPGTSPHGSDGIFCDINNKIIFFGEAKFTINIKSSLEQALTSLKNIENRIKLDENFILIHEGDMKNNFTLEIFDENKLLDYKKCVIIFSLHGTEYTDEEIRIIFSSYYDKFTNALGSNIEFELISFPILSKNGLKKEISRQVQNLYEDN